MDVLRAGRRLRAAGRRERDEVGRHGRGLGALQVLAGHRGRGSCRRPPRALAVRQDDVLGSGTTPARCPCGSSPGQRPGRAPAPPPGGDRSRLQNDCRRGRAGRIDAEGRIDILFSDVVMPDGLNGAQLAIVARRKRPDLRVLLTSGYTEKALSAEHGVAALPDGPVLAQALPTRGPRGDARQRAKKRALIRQDRETIRWRRWRPTP
jgi:hypothetical protein